MYFNPKNIPFVCIPISLSSRFDNLAHVPRGTPSGESTLRVYRLHRESATMTLLSVNGTLENPAFLRFHPEFNVLYACTEDITKDNEVGLGGENTFRFSLHFFSSLIKQSPKCMPKCGRSPFSSSSGWIHPMLLLMFTRWVIIISGKLIKATAAASQSSIGPQF